MVVQLFIAALMIALSAAAEIKFPETGNACILINFKSNNSLSWTPKNGSEMAIPNWNIAKSTYKIDDGNCTGTPYVVIRFIVDNATMRFDFNNATNKVDVKMTLDFVPEIVFGSFNNTDNSTVSISTSLFAGTVEEAYKCNAEKQVTGKDKSAEYGLILRFTDMKIQGYGVENSTFSKDVYECEEDKTTTQETTTEHITTATNPPTTAVPTSAPKVTLKATDGNATCAMMMGKFTFMIPYNGTKKTSKTANIYIPKDVKTEGKCMNANKTDILTANFYGDNFKMTFAFKGDKDNIWLDQWDATIVYAEEFFPDIDASQKGKSANFSVSFDKAFKAKNTGSYLCDSDTTTGLKDGLQLKTTDFQYTALQSNVTKFGDKDVAECSADAKTSSVVPIAVGAALAGLVVIVLIAYLIGRRRNRKGYESV